MYPARFFLVLGAAAFAVALVLLAPLARVQAWVKTDAESAAVTLRGNLLGGHADWPSVNRHLEWVASPGWLLLAGIGGSWRLNGGGAEAGGTFFWQPWRLAVDVERASVAAEVLNARLVAAGAEVDQPLFVRDLELRFGPMGGLRGADGILVFGPGHLQLRDRPAPIALPALRGKADTSDGKVVVVVDAQPDPGRPLAVAHYSPSTSEAHVAVYQRGAGLFGIDAPPGRSPDTVLFEWRQVLH